MTRNDQTSAESIIFDISKKLPKSLRNHDRVFILRNKLSQLDKSSLNVVYNHICQKLVDLGLLGAPLTKDERADIRAELEKSPWMNVECLNAKHAKQACFDKWKANPCQATANAWKAACDKLREELLKLRQFWIEQIHSVDYFQEYEDIPLTDASRETPEDSVTSRSEGKYLVYSLTDNGGHASQPSGTSSPLDAGRQSRERSRSPLSPYANKGSEHQFSSHDCCKPPDSCSRRRNYCQNQSYDDHDGCLIPQDSTAKFGRRQCSRHRYRFHPPEWSRETVHSLLGSDDYHYRGDLAYPTAYSLHHRGDYTCYFPTGEGGECSAPKGANGCDQRYYEVYCPTSSFSSASYRQHSSLPLCTKDKKSVPRRYDVIISEYSRSVGDPYQD